MDQNTTIITRQFKCAKPSAITLSSDGLIRIGRYVIGSWNKITEGEDDMRLAFELKFNRRLYDDYKRIDVLRMIKHTFLDTTFDKIDNYLLIDKIL